MSEEQKPQETAGGQEMTDEQKAKAARFPITDRPQLVLDEVTGMVWFGLNLSRIPKLEAICQLDQAKIHLLAWYRKRDAAPKIALPHQAQSAMAHMRAGLGRIMGR